MSKCSLEEKTKVTEVSGTSKRNGLAFKLYSISFLVMFYTLSSLNKGRNTSALVFNYSITVSKVSTDLLLEVETCLNLILTGSSHVEGSPKIVKSFLRAEKIPTETHT